MANNVTPIAGHRRASDAPCHTPTFAACWNVLAYTQEKHTLCAVTAPAGLGKTTAALEYAQQNRGVYYFVATMRTRTERQLTAALKRFFDGAYGDPSDPEMYSSIRHSMGDGALLIIDEAHLLADNALELLRYLVVPFEGQARIAIALIGNPILISTRDGKNRAAYSQFLSRLQPRLTLEAPFAEDYETLFDHHKIAGARSRARIKAAADAFGALRVASAIIDRAKELANGRAIELSHVEAAIGFLGYQ